MSPAGTSYSGNREASLMQECMTAALEEARALEAVVSGKSADTVDRKLILEFTEKIQEINARLKGYFNPQEGRSKILERFFIQWNNMLFGLFYVSLQLQEKGFITNRQFEILGKSLDEIIKILEKNPTMGRKVGISREEA